MVYPLPKFHFVVSDGSDNVAFSECSGLDVETEVIEYRSGEQRDYTKLKIPGMRKTANVVLGRGMVAGNNSFFEWWNTASLNKVERRNITISLLNEEHQPVASWQVKDAWPAKITSTDLKADGNEIAIEKIELAHQGITIVMN